ncbi:MAG: RNA polymerase sigma factor [Myxococcota bacterium]
MAARPDDEGQLAAARRGDRAAFDALFEPEIPKLRGVLRRLVGTSDDVDDLVQQSLLRAFEQLEGFRGEAGVGTWLCSIGTRLGIDLLRSRKRWRERAQVILAARCLEDEALGREVGSSLGRPDFQYDVGEHIAYCFTCVGRTLSPPAQAALVLRDVLQLSNDEAARAVNVSRSVLRHELAGARKQMQETYAGLCAVVSKTGACWQCAGLRQASPEGKRGPDVPVALDWEGRLRIVRQAALDRGYSSALHDVLFRQTEAQEASGAGDEDAATECGRGP